MEPSEIKNKVQIEITNLTHRFPDGTEALRDVNLSIRQGAFVVIAGPNGSGKTTLIRHLNGLLWPSDGAVRIMGDDVVANPALARRRVGMVFQEADSQIVGETVTEDVAFGPENLGLPSAEIDQRVQTAIRTLGLQHLADQRPHVLSGGEKRRLAIAGVLAMHPEILIFDEPFTHLDYPGTREVLSHIIKLNQSGHTVLVTTHDLEKVIAHADRLALLFEGRVVRDGAPEIVLPEVESFGVRAPCAVHLGLEVTPWLAHP